MKISVTDPDVQKFIGKKVRCSQGIEFTIEGLKELPWGLSFVGKDADGIDRASRNPELIEDN